MRGAWLRRLWRNPDEGGVLGINRRNLDLVFSDYKPGRFGDLDDKLASKRILEAVDVATPRTLGVVEQARDMHVLDTLLAEQESMVIKPAKGWGGRGILVLEKTDGVWCRIGGRSVTGDAIRDHVADVLAGIHSLDEDADHAICEELIRPHAFFAEISPAGLCDIRIVVEKGVAIQAMARVPTLESDGKANLHGGGVGLGIDLRDGRITGAIVKDRPVERHPDTGVELLGRTLPAWSRCRELAIVAAGAFDLDYVGVDIVVDRDRGPLVLEVNARPGLAIQIANASGQPVRGLRRESRGDRLTSRVNWLFMALLVLSPLLHHLWQRDRIESLVVDVGVRDVRESVGVENRTERDERDERESMVPEVQAEELDLADESEMFAAARSAVAEGDTTGAVEIYRRALAEPELAPFALNNLALIAKRAGRIDEAVALLEDAVARYPGYQRGHFNLGLALVRAGRTEAARSAFEQSLELKPNHAPSWSSLGALLADADELEAAADAYGRAIRYAPTDPDPRFRLGLIQRRLDDYAAADETLADLAALAPEHEGAAYWYGRTRRDLTLAAGAELSSLLATRGILAPFVVDSRRCRSLLAKLSAEGGEPAVALPHFRALGRSRYRADFHNLAAAATALDLGLWTVARDAALQVLDDEPAAAAALAGLALIGARAEDPGVGTPADESAATPLTNLLAAALEGNGNGVRRWYAEVGAGAWPDWLAGYADALEIPADLLPHAPSPAPLTDRLGADAPPAMPLQLYVGLTVAEGRGQQATADRFEQALRATVPEFAPLLRRDFARASVDSLPLARTLGERLLALGPDDPLLVLEVAEVYADLGRERRAGRLLRSLPERVRAGAAARSLEGRLAVAEGRFRQAVRILEPVLDRAPADVAAREALARAHLGLEEPDAAVAEFERARDLAPQRLDIRRGLADALTRARRYPAAVVAWSEVVALDPDDLAALFKLALSRQRSGDEAGALAVYDELLARDPQRTAALFNRGLALERLGRPDDAVAAYRHLLTLVPDHKAGRRHLDALQGDTR